MTGTGPFNMFTYARQSTVVRPRIMSPTIKSVAPPGHSRSIPRGVDTPVSSKGRPAKAEERPIDIGTSGTQGAPATEPVYPPTLEPVSHL